MATAEMSKLLGVAEQLDPSAPAVQVANAALQTVANPSVGNIVADIELALSLIKDLKVKLTGVHPSVVALIKWAI